MKKILKTYKSTLILLGAIILGGIIGIIFKEDALFLKPFGDIFINLLFIVIVPLIFVTLTTGIIKTDSPKRLGKIMSRIVIVFAVMSVVAVLVGMSGAYLTKLVEKGDTVAVKELLDQKIVADEDISILDRTVSLVTVTDFPALFSKNNIIALLIFSVMFGVAVRMSKEKGKVIKDGLISLNEIVLNLVKIIMYYAPIGLGCYFAALVGTYGSSIATGFLKTFIIYTLTCLVLFVVIYSIYALIAGGKKGLKIYWKNILRQVLQPLQPAHQLHVYQLILKQLKILEYQVI